MITHSFSGICRRNFDMFTHTCRYDVIYECSYAGLLSWVVCCLHYVSETIVCSHKETWHLLIVITCITLCAFVDSKPLYAYVYSSRNKVTVVGIGHDVFGLCVRPSVHTFSQPAVCLLLQYLHTQWMDLNETWHEYSSRKWAVLNRFSQSAVNE